MAGLLPRKPKIAFAGAGSTVFTSNLVGGAPAAVEPTLDRRAALAGADYAVTSFQVGGCNRRASTSRCPSGRSTTSWPASTCVEVPCVASAGGIEPQAVGALPHQLAALIQTNVSVQRLIVDDLIEAHGDLIPPLRARAGP